MQLKEWKVVPELMSIWRPAEREPILFGLVLQRLRRFRLEPRRGKAHGE